MLIMLPLDVLNIIQCNFFACGSFFGNLAQMAHHRANNTRNENDMMVTKAPDEIGPHFKWTTRAQLPSSLRASNSNRTRNHLVRKREAFGRFLPVCNLRREDRAFVIAMTKLR